ncbi:hypothetical protein E1A91_A01G220200v1 [Gossypium mustelinum]|uniref:Uncharacterized protein n=1 Tax=Gossypium mustelinum TaxID=34275 RepID=A0A5D3AJN1_GOSMU|nr:hypothetical protein E1A91_A01G220200v1 [Gossypium mustelinum]
MGPESLVTKRLDGKVALITSGASGLGECSARLFLKHGAKVLIADIQDELGHSLCKELGNENFSYVHCDVTCESDVENAINLAVSKYGKLDIMFNNADLIGDEVRVTDASTDNFKSVRYQCLGWFLRSQVCSQGHGSGQERLHSLLVEYFFKNQHRSAPCIQGIEAWRRKVDEEHGRGVR